MTTRKIIEADICASCVNVCLLEPPPLSGPWEKKALCTAGWPYKRVFASANAIDDCPQYEQVMQPIQRWPFKASSAASIGEKMRQEDALRRLSKLSDEMGEEL